MAFLYTGWLLRSRQLSPQTKHFEFEVAGPDRFDFAAGQFVSMVARAMKLVCPNCGEELVRRPRGKSKG